MPDAPLKDGAAVDDGIAVGAPLASVRRPSLRLTRGRLILLALLALAAAAAAVLVGGHTTAQHRASAPVPQAHRQVEQPPPLRPHPKVVVAVAPGELPPPEAETTASTGSTATAARAPSDAEVRSELVEFRHHLSLIGTPRGPIPRVTPDGTAVAPSGAPEVVAAVISAGNAIATTPYKWGGGHGAWRDTGYDCSGSVSFALAGAGLLESPLDSTGFMHYGAAGPGRWITIYASHGHAFMVVAGLRFDTSGARGGTRWQPENGRSYSGFVARHPPGY